VGMSTGHALTFKKSARTAPGVQVRRGTFQGGGLLMTRVRVHCRFQRLGSGIQPVSSCRSGLHASSVASQCWYPRRRNASAKVQAKKKLGRTTAPPKSPGTSRVTS
jgi:hypothetical protein